MLKILNYKALISLAIISVLTFLDQITKIMAKNNLKDQVSLSYFNKSFWLTYAENKGAFLSFGASLSEELRFIIFSILVGIVLIVTFIHLFKNLEDNVYVLSLSLILAGGIGNLIDRVLFGFVTDFIFMKIWVLRTGIFNLADVFIVMGIACLLLHSIFLEKKKALAQTQSI